MHCYPKTLQYVFPKSKDILLHKYYTVTKIRKFDLDICYIIHCLYLKYATVSIISSTTVFFFFSPGNEICHSEVSFSLLLLRTVVNYLNKFWSAQPSIVNYRQNVVQQISRTSFDTMESLYSMNSYSPFPSPLSRWQPPFHSLFLGVWVF